MTLPRRQFFFFGGKDFCRKKDFPWQEKLIAPLITNLIGYLQCEDRVTKNEGKKTATILQVRSQLNYIAIIDILEFAIAINWGVSRR